MLKKSYKLPIQEFIKKKPSIFGRSTFFIAKKLSNNLSYSRFGVVISKKVDKRAVARNKIKRDIFKYISSENLYKKKGTDILIIVYPAIKNIDKNILENELKKILT